MENFSTGLWTLSFQKFQNISSFSRMWWKEEEMKTWLKVNFTKWKDESINSYSSQFGVSQELSTLDKEHVGKVAISKRNSASF